MATDRQDIDALLIGALYGELDGDERARLDAHLASHPQDRAALDGMRSTRAMLRDADVAAMLGAAEPSPAISARLIQEAARRAPVKAAGVGFFAFLATLFRPLVSNPALSAAAAFVLIGGAAGILYTRGNLTKSEPQVARHEAAGTAPDVAAAPRGPATTGGAPGSAVDDYRVSLEEGQALKNDTHADQLGAAAIADGEGEAHGAGDEIAGNQTARKGGAKRDATVALDGRLAQEKERSGEFAFSAEQGKDGKASVAKKVPTSGSTFGDTGGAAAATRPGYIPVEGVGEPPAVLTPDGARADNDATAKREVARTQAPERRNVAADKPGPPADPAPAPPPGAPSAGAQQKPAQIARDAGKTGGTAYDPAAARALETWARDQHARMVKLVNQGKCTDAGAIGAEIARRAPDYYQTNVANDRQVRSCRSYVDRARKAKSEDQKTKAAAPRSPSPAPDQDMESPAVH